MSVAIPDFGGVRVLVAGDLMLDQYWFGPTSRISPEAPVPVVRVQRAEARAGGAANVAMNLVSLGARTTWKPAFVLEESLKPGHLAEDAERSYGE